MNKKEEKFCNLCGLTCRLNDMDSFDCNYGLIDAKAEGGYASTPGNGSGALDDCIGYEFNLCEFCLDWLFSIFKISPSVFDHVTGKYINEQYLSAENRVAKDDWRKMKKEFFEEKERRDLARFKR